MKISNSSVSNHSLTIYKLIAIEKCWGMDSAFYIKIVKTSNGWGLMIHYGSKAILFSFKTVKWES